MDPLRASMLAVLFLGCAGQQPQVQPAAPVSAAWSALAEEGIAAGEYAPQADGDAFRATNRAQDLHATFGPHGLNVSGRSGTGEVGLSLRGWGREDSVTAADTASPEEGPCLSGGAVDAFGDCLHRVDYARPGLTEWWENRSEGLEQGFTVTAPPEGDGALVFELSLTGALADVDGNEALLVRESGDPLRFGGLAAWDATGRSLPAWMEETDGGLRILVDDSGAIGAVTVDPLLTTASWTAESDQTGADFGVSVASAGDVNGDGYGDVVVGAYTYDNGQADEGRAYLYLGSAAGLGTTAAWTAEPNQYYVNFGFPVASAGDVNGDGYSDVIVGATGYIDGKAFVYLGSASGLGASAAWTVGSGQYDYPAFGSAVGSAGDVNGDGYGDVVVGAEYYDNGQTDEGRIFIYLGSASGLGTTPASTAESDQSGAYFGRAAGTAGDVNGDGYSDVIVGAPNAMNGQINEGRAFVYLGSAAGLANAAAWTGEADQVEAYFGQSVAGAGDVNGDGYADVVVGAPGYTNGSSAEGRASVYLGSATGLSASASWSVESDQASAGLGGAVAPAGDVNGDGYGDVVVGAAFYDNGQTDEGRAYLYLGSAAGLATTAAWTVESDQTGASAVPYFGNSVAGAGDVNGDGFGDVLVGALGYDNGQTDEGRAYVYMGAASGLSTSAGWTGEQDQASASLGYAVASAGDVNGDGYGDVIVGAPQYTNGQSSEGRALLYLGSVSGLATTAAWTAESDMASSLFGRVVASAGDVNGDGYGDVVVGAEQFSNGEPFEGRAFLFLGSASGLTVGAAWTAESNQAYAYFAGSVASAGDVNGDGFGDVVVGAATYDHGQSDEGQAFLFLGSAAGLQSTPAWSAESDQAGSNFGFAVSSAGDVDSDGYADVVIGAYNYSNGEYLEGRAYLYSGSAAGLAATASWTSESDQEGANFGRAVASAGDVNGDGYGDLLVGAYLYDNGSADEGRAYLYLGSARGLSTTAAWNAEPDQTSAYFARSLASAGDVNGDGYGDVVVGAYLYDNGTPDEGRAFVFLGSAGGLMTSPAWTAESDQSYGFLGRSVASAGDVNGDGYGDLVAGANGYDNGQTDEGRAYVYMGNGADGTGLGLARAAQARHPSLTTPITPGLTSTSTSGFDVAIAKARGPWGRAKVKLQIETKPQGTAFNGSGLTTSSSYTSSGLTGASLQQAVSGLTTATGYHWRARVLASPAEGRSQGWGPWMYGGLSGRALGGHVFTAGTTYYADTDGDGYGNAASPAQLRGVTLGYVSNATDCNDGSGAVHPGATETCDGIDDNCDGTADPSTSVGAPSWHADADADGYGATGPGTPACAAPSGMLADASDCNDADDIVNPGATESCDGFDNDCDGVVDPTTSAGAYTWYMDADDDGFGDPALDVVSCTPPAHTSLNEGDCDDTTAAVSPDGTESCNGVDDDCNGQTDESGATGETTWYADADADTYGNETSHVLTCNVPAGYVSGSTDCDDAVAAVHPGATESCNHRDDDCDGATDESGSTGETTFFVDADFDTYGDPARTVVTCWEGAGAAADDDDCDDTLASVNPAALEYCNEIDDDCNGITDDPTAEDAVVYYRDVDGDGYGGKRRPVLTCEQPSGYSAYATDCRDSDATAYPGAPEACDGVDDDCDGVVDDAGATIQPAWYTDADSDGYGAGSATYACTRPAHLDDDALDCDDAVYAVHPGATEVCDSLDNNCDGAVDPSTSIGAATWHADADSDGYGSSATGTTACTAPSGYLTNATDCDDAAAAVHPGAFEVCNSVDDNCDGLTDPSTSVGASTWHADADGDGYGSSTAGTTACTAPSGYLANATDCNDAVNAVHPGATETCNSIDDNCDGVTDPSTSVGAATWHADADHDGYGASGGGTLACTAPVGSLADATDCNDGASGVHPGATETCNSIDDNCDGTTDPPSSVGAPTWYVDADGDGYGTLAGALSSCTVIAGRVGNGTDCDDLVNTTYPAAPERCDGERNDCTISAWTSANENGQVWFETDAGVWTSYTSTFAAGVSGTPAAVTLPVGGTMWVCDGTYYVRLTASAAGSTSVAGLYDAGILSAGGVGSVVTVSGASANLSLNGLTLQNGVGSGAPTRGGGLRVTAGTATVDGCLIRNNTATQGAGLSVVGGTVTVTSSDIRSNVASTGGGWYQSGGTLTMNSTVVELNTAADGGGGYYATGPFTSTGLSLLDNAATATGGGLRANNAMTLTSATIIGNDAVSGAGVYYGAAGGTLALASTLVDQNAATGYGGGVYQAGGTLTCTGSTAGTYGFTANTAVTGGGGVYLPLTTSVFTTTLCDFGATVATSNSPNDVLYGATAYNKNNDVTMTCRTGTCR